MTADTGDLEPTEGDARRSHTLRVGRYAQHFVDALQMDSNPVEYLLNKSPKVSALLSVGPQDALPSKYSSALCCQRALGRAAEVASAEQGVQSGQQPL